MESHSTQEDSNNEGVGLAPANTPTVFSHVQAIWPITSAAYRGSRDTHALRYWQDTGNGNTPGIVIEVIIVDR
jgi:hypothetical protein